MSLEGAEFKWKSLHFFLQPEIHWEVLLAVLECGKKSIQTIRHSPCLRFLQAPLSQDLVDDKRSSSRLIWEEKALSFLKPFLCLKRSRAVGGALSVEVQFLPLRNTSSPVMCLHSALPGQSQEEARCCLLGYETWRENSPRWWISFAEKLLCCCQHLVS